MGRGITMKQSEINALPEKLQLGLISEKEVILAICNFIMKNAPVFGLQKYDEDLRQDILLDLVERGHHIIHLYNPELGDFFTFIYCFICTLINTRIKKYALLSMRDKLNYEESILNYEEKEVQYTQIDYKSFELPKVPYSHKKLDPADLQKMVQELSLNHHEKKVIILALKSSYYLTDDQIQRICKIYHIKKECFYTLVQHCKNSLSKKSEKRTIAEKRRNYAYYHHKRYRTIIQNLDDDLTSSQTDLFKENLKVKELKHRKNWNKLNNSFEKGFLYLRPSTKTVANLMGICERQVNYYINCAKKDSKKNDDY